MEDEKSFLDYPYYEMTYFDDDNIMHFAQVKDENSVSFLKQRFTVKTCSFINV